MRMLGNLTSSLGLVVRLAQAQDEGVYRDEHSALAKAISTYRMHEAVGWAGQILGGNGIVLDYNVGRLVADAIYSYEGTREMNSLVTGRAIAGSSAFVRKRPPIKATRWRWPMATAARYRARRPAIRK